jgi:hypothetical protein
MLLRRPLEAMSRTLPLVFVYWLVIAFSRMKKLYLWAQRMVERWRERGAEVGIHQRGDQAHAIEFKRPMLNPRHVLDGGLFCFAIWGFYTWRLNRWD